MNFNLNIELTEAEADQLSELLFHTFIELAKRSDNKALLSAIGKFSSAYLKYTAELAKQHEAEELEFYSKILPMLSSAANIDHLNKSWEAHDETQT